MPYKRKPLEWTAEELLEDDLYGDVGRKMKNYDRISCRGGDKPLSLGDVLFPLRYDIYVMAEYMTFYDVNKDKPRDWLLVNIPEYMRRRIEIVHDLRRRWGFITDMPKDKWERRKAKYNQANVEIFMGLWESVGRRGFLGTGEGKLTFRAVADNSRTHEDHVPPRGSLYLTNGQHRMAVLLAMDKTEIPPEWYNVAIVRNFQPIETTHEYIKRDWISEAEFVDFARLRFPGIPSEMDTVKDFGKWAYDTGKPAWVHYYMGLYWGT